MGCGISRDRSVTRDAGKNSTARLPILIFCLPGEARAVFGNVVMGEGAAQGTTPKETGLNIRFIDMPNQRNSRRNWSRDLIARKDFVSLFFIADVRDRPQMMLTARTYNWFLRSIDRGTSMKTVIIYSDKKQYEEFETLVVNLVEPVPLCELDPDTVSNLFAVLHEIERKNAGYRPTQGKRMNAYH